jgi:Ca2+-binding RTX toxin-like protein
MTTGVFIDGGGGNDTEFGGSGDDEFIVEHGVNHLFGGTGHDKIDFNDATFAGDSTDPLHPTDHGEISGDHIELDFSAVSGGSI